MSPAIRLVGQWHLLIRTSYSQNYKTAISDKITCWEGEQFPLKLAATLRWTGWHQRTVYRYSVLSCSYLSRAVCAWAFLMMSIYYTLFKAQTEQYDSQKKKQQSVSRQSTAPTTSAGPPPESTGGQQATTVASRRRRRPTVPVPIRPRVRCRFCSQLSQILKKIAPFCFHSKHPQRLFSFHYFARHIFLPSGLLFSWVIWSIVN